MGMTIHFDRSSSRIPEARRGTGFGNMALSMLWRGMLVAGVGGESMGMNLWCWTAVNHGCMIKFVGVN